MGVIGGPVVVKLGGSFAFSTYLQNWLGVLTSCRSPVVVVPGGGPFADAVRSAQSNMGFDDRAAHRMALLAMEQYGHALISRNRMLAPADSIAAIECALARGHVPVWMPARMVAAASDIADSWDVTSDSLAAWLAGELAASRLVLVKHLEFPVAQRHFDELAAIGVVDKAFPQYIRTSAVPFSIVGQTDYDAAIAAIRDDAKAGMAAPPAAGTQPQRC
jgi:5-(aminomethyl)-3-furanmethanol phosphate kinase